MIPDNDNDKKNAYIFEPKGSVRREVSPGMMLSLFDLI